MSVASSSSLRILRTRATPITASAIRYASTSTETYNPTYIPRPYSRDGDSDSFQTSFRPPRPSSPVFFTGKPTYSAALEEIEQTVKSTHAALRVDYLYPLPRQLSLPHAPDVRWKTREDMATIFGEKLGIQAHRKISEMLNELNRGAFLADLGGKADLADGVYAFLTKYSKEEIARTRKVKKEKSLDEFGRAYGAGRRKNATARVWIIPSQSALSALDVPAEKEARPHAVPKASVAETSDALQEIPSGDFLVNQLPLPVHFSRPTIREKVLRPLRLTGLLGAYNVFALVQGGGNSGQAGAIQLALARALVVMRKDTKEVLYADGALMRDPRMVERKKTNLLKARAARAWVKR